MNPWTEVDRLRAKNMELRRIVGALALAVAIMFLVLVLHG